jgi:UDP-N-acetylmuramoyl-tripeptide--D-alanyl-D-alanine ligase
MATPIPSNDAAFTLDELARATGGAVANAAGVGGVASVSTDSRDVRRGGLFVALRGESFDGHAHVAAAAAKGARAVIVERDVEVPEGVAVVRVASTLEALGALARHHARRWRASGLRRTVGVTGSAGKTTTRVAITALADAVWPGRVLATRGNLNNRVGLPMTMLTLEERHDVAVLELGMNQPGEIATLAAIAEPDVGVVTLVAEAHTELVGSIDLVAREKGALFQALAPGGVAIGNADDARVRGELSRSPARKKLLYGYADDADVRIALRDVASMTRARLELAVRDRGLVAFETPLLGEAGALASAAAVAVVAFGLGGDVTSDVAARGFAAAEVGAGAGRLVPRAFASGLAVVDDSYNANPASMRASIRAAAELARATGRRLVLVLGEMLELGAISDDAHADVGRAAAASGAEVIVAVSGRARLIAEAAKVAGVWVEFREDAAEATNVVVRAVTSGDLVLVKGSRGVATESIVRALEGVHQAPPTIKRPSSEPPKAEGA